MNVTTSQKLNKLIFVANHHFEVDPSLYFPKNQLDVIIKDCFDTNVTHDPIAKTLFPFPSCLIPKNIL
jgi:hypothetical protein